MRVLTGILEILNSKIFLYILIGIIGFGTLLHVRSCNTNEKLETYNRQVKGQLTAHEKKLQQSYHKLGVLESQLLSEKELFNYWKDSKESTDKEFERYIKEYNLKIKSLDSTIAALNQKIKTGESSTIISDHCDINEECIISYTWRDKDGRFILKDPNIFKPNDETFELHQLFAIKGVIAEQKDGSLQIRRVTLVEVLKDSSGKYQPIQGAKANIIDSDFKYSNPPDLSLDLNWPHLFRVRGIFISGIGILPNTGSAILGVGVELLNFNRIGVGTYMAFDFQHPELISQHIFLQHSPSKLNLGVFVSIGTPFVELFNSYQFNAGLTFYLNN